MKTIYNFLKKAKSICMMLLVSFGCSLLIFSCEEVLEVEPPKSFVDTEKVFSDDATAISSARGMYADMLTSNHPFNGNSTSLLALTSLSSDELFHPPGTNTAAVQFQENELMADNELVLGTWRGIYQSIYSANALVEGLEVSNNISDAIISQLTGEALFIRAFCQFYLVNLFGEVPVITSTDYHTNSMKSRMEISEVYKQIVDDLLKAQELLNSTYTDGDRVRPNKVAATALLARVYLFLGEWEKAEVQASTVIDDTNYSLVDINTITLSNNKEAIWQLHSSSLVSNSPTTEGINFNSPANRNALREEFLDAFEPGDIRHTEWIRLDDSSFYAPFKYKIGGSGGNREEYSTILRLAEQYLIRAEAQAHQNKLGEAIIDVDVIRQRAGLELIAESNPDIGQEELLDMIMQERRLELFTEWGHRWLDLKRTGQASTILSAIKTGFTEEDELYPIPQEELNNSPNLNDQNPGY